MKACPNCGLKPKNTREFRKDGTPRTKIIGRPTVCDYVEIKKLRDQGLSFRNIALKMNVSKGAIEYQLRKIKC